MKAACMQFVEWYVNFMQDRLPATAAVARSVA